MGEVLKLPIGELFDIEKGSLQSLKNSPGEYDFITAAEEWKTHDEFSHDMEALIFAAAASGSLGRTHYVNGKFITSDLCYILTPKNSNKYPIDLKFYHFVFNSLKEEIVKDTKSGTSKEAINQKSFKSYELPYFEIEKQHLWIQKLINTKQHQQELLSEFMDQEKIVDLLRQSILQEAIEGKLTAQWRKEKPDIETASKLLEKIRANNYSKKEKLLPKIDDNEILFDIPTTWEWCKFGELCHYEQGIQVDLNLQFKQYQEGLVRFLRILDFTQETDDLRYIKDPGKKYHIDENELVMVRYGASAGFVGTNKTGVLANNLFKIKYGDLNIKYLRYFFETEYFKYELGMNTKGVAMPAISFKFLDLLVFPLPPIEEQNVIVEKINSLFSICDEIEEHISVSKTNVKMLMQSVLKEAFAQ